MSTEIDVPVNDIVVGQRYKFYYNQDNTSGNPVYATVQAFNPNNKYPNIVLTNMIDAVTNEQLSGSRSTPVNWFSRVTVNNIGPAGTGLNTYINSFLGGIKRKRRSLKRRKSKRRKSSRKSRKH